MQTDVLIVGAGPVGIATAIAASLKGLRVTLVDSRKPPIDRPGGEGLLPEAMLSLRSIEIRIDSTVGFPLTGIHFSDEDHSASAQIQKGEAFGFRRVALHQLLISRAEELGISFLWGARISNPDSRRSSVDGA
jgi:flavin-dependent dehydrogenase